ncbi:family S53 protease-like protein [Mycena albidolilacea]|uniref:tripeptidyl-peptidase II n=1 Tax=Mycena albidolilacea TaxID=1033008 RepID=A0AAD6YZW0_9AGAR|nr:family S53 protease-like protein [Mycena albidolilacea]
MFLHPLFAVPMSWILPLASARMVLHERATAPAGFIRLGPASASKEITLRVALTANNITGLQDKLLSISTPGSPDFRQWLSMDEVKAFVQPSQETLAAFTAFTSANNLTSAEIAPNGDWVSMTLPVAHANTLFGAQFDEFTHPGLGNTTILRTLSVSLPAELVGHVDVLHPTTAFAGLSQLRLAGSSPTIARRATPDASCDTTVSSGVITPACLEALYGIPTTPATSSGNVLGVPGYIDEFVDPNDVAEFLALMRPDIDPNTTFSVVSINGGVNVPNQVSMGEAVLDVEYAIGMATGVPIQFLTVGSDLTHPGFAMALLDTTTYLDGIADPPTVLTTSYTDTESVVGSSLATKICNGYMALGARGISVLFSSGDGGPRTIHDDLSLCSNNTFQPVFPASCPYVTTVGATQGSYPSPEVATNFTGGGWSDFFPSPSYQSVAVASFLERLPWDFQGVFNKSGRAYPDVAFQGWNFRVVLANETSLTGGTSASTPAFAGMTALLNDRLIAAGKPVLGFLNPFLYSLASAGKGFNDITEGHNSGFVCPASTASVFLTVSPLRHIRSISSHELNQVAFDAAVGWDPLTGWGTPKFEELLAAALAY